MSRDPYIDLCLTAQAVRRDFEGIRTPVATAIGVAASVYTHQLANTHRVLTDLRVRHLLADEVGLGKTVQALMVLNALRYQRKDLRALVVVPDRLVPQWRDEILTRAHSAPIGERAEGGQYIRLAWEAQLKIKTTEDTPTWSLSDIDPAMYDVLVVDELHRLRSDVQDRIVRAAGAFDHVLVLTATPAFQDVKRHAQLFAILEPERSAALRRLAGRSPATQGSEDFSTWPEGAAKAVVEGILERDRSAASEALSSDVGSAETVALAHCAYRRVIRTRRVDYHGVLPARRHIALLTEPLGAEAERQSLMWRYFNCLGAVSLDIDPVRLAKRVILSPTSLEQRVDFLRRQGHEREGLLEKAKPLVHRSQGDSRADTLVDLLNEIWTQDPSERVLVAAQDNLTVDYLFDLVSARLPMIGTLGQRIPLVAARVRQGMMTEAVEDLGGFGNETNENLEAFQRGEAQVLFAPEAAQVGLNLQCARILVLYSVPWRPEEVEQWIGRLDRIGNVASLGTDGMAKTIDVYTIAQKGLVDEKVVSVLERFQAFERSVNLDGAHLEEVATLIETAALRPESVNWRDLENTTEAMAAQDQVEELKSSLRSRLPWTVQWAIGLRQHLQNLPPAPLALRRSGTDGDKGPRSWDRAFEGMLKLLVQAKEYHIRKNTDPDGGRFRTLWYWFEKGADGPPEVRSKVLFSFGADPGRERSPRFAHAFITRRSDIGTPPRRSVTMTLEQGEAERTLRFFNFGDRLHDELVAGWMPRTTDTLWLKVDLVQEHPFFAVGQEGLYVLRLLVLDPESALKVESTLEAAIEAVASAANRMSLERLIDLIKPFSRSLTCAIYSDIRWLRAQLAPQLRVEGMKHANGRWTKTGVEELGALLNPIVRETQRRSRSADWQPSDEYRRVVQSVFDKLSRADRSASMGAWSSLFKEFDRVLEERRYLVREEGRDAQTLAQLELSDGEETVRMALERGNRAQITRAQNARDEKADAPDMIRTLWEQRDGWLQRCGAMVRSAVPVERIKAVVQVRRTT